LKSGPWLAALPALPLWRRSPKLPLALQQLKPDAPLLPIAVERGSLLVEAHDQADAALDVLIGERHAVAYAEIGAAGC